MNSLSETVDQVEINDQNPSNRSSQGVSNIENGSPAWCINKLLAQRNKLEEKLANHFDPQKGFIFGCLFVAALLFIELWGFTRAGFKFPVRINTDFVFGIAMALAALVLN